jgi:two-component system, LytTR family, sensor kinase
MFGHRFKFLFPGALGLYSFLNILLMDGDRLFQAELAPLFLFYVVFLLSYAVWFLNLGIETFLTEKSKNIHPLIFQFLLSTVAMVGITFLSVKLTGVLFGGPFDYSQKNFLLTLGFTSRINLFLNCLNAIYFFSSKLKEKAVETEKLKTLTTEAKLESINTHLNPHFFFNNLSTLSALIHQDVNLASQYLQKLSVIYRYILNNRGNELVPLDEELEFLQTYLDLLAIRFNDSLQFSLELDRKCLNSVIPPAVLLLLVENVVKHNYFTFKEPLELKIFNDCDSITVHNKKQPKDVVEFSTGIGIQNITDRYRFLNLNVRVEDRPDYFKVKLPLISGNEFTFSRRRTLGPEKNTIHP